MARMILPEPRSARLELDDGDAKVTEVTRQTLDAIGDLATQYIALAKIEVKDELALTLRRSFWHVAAGAAGALAAVLLVIAVFLLAGGIIESPGIRLLILAVLVGIGAFALVLYGDTFKRPGGTDQPGG